MRQLIKLALGFAVFFGFVVFLGCTARGDDELKQLTAQLEAKKAKPKADPFDAGNRAKAVKEERPDGGYCTDECSCGCNEGAPCRCATVRREYSPPDLYSRPQTRYEPRYAPIYYQQAPAAFGSFRGCPGGGG